MTRERKEIFKKMERLEMQEQAENELGCGMFQSEIGKVFAPHWQSLCEKLAATYGKTVKEYEEMCYEEQERLYSAGILPFC
jgi:hypothetical protein